MNGCKQGSMMKVNKRRGEKKKWIFNQPLKRWIRNSQVLAV